MHDSIHSPTWSSDGNAELLNALAMATKSKKHIAFNISPRMRDRELKKQFFFFVPYCPISPKIK